MMVELGHSCCAMYHGKFANMVVLCRRYFNLTMKTSCYNCACPSKHSPPPLLANFRCRTDDGGTLHSLLQVLSADMALYKYPMHS